MNEKIAYLLAGAALGMLACLGFTAGGIYAQGKASSAPGELPITELVEAEPYDARATGQRVTQDLLEASEAYEAPISDLITNAKDIPSNPLQAAATTFAIIKSYNLPSIPQSGIWQTEFKEAIRAGEIEDFLAGASSALDGWRRYSKNRLSDGTVPKSE